MGPEGSALFYKKTLAISTIFLANFLQFVTLITFYIDSSFHSGLPYNDDDDDDDNNNNNNNNNNAYQLKTRY